MDKTTLNNQVVVKNFSLEGRTVYGFALHSSLDGGATPYFDLYNDHITDEAIEKVAPTVTGAKVFVQHDPTHLLTESQPAGRITSSFPLTKSICESMGIKSDMTGLLIGITIDNEEVLRRVKSGSLRAFSIGFYTKRKKREGE